MRANINQISIGRVISQIFKRIEEINDMKSPKIYEYIDEELSTLEEICTTKELIDLRYSIYELYILIKNKEEN